jgi:very-short-patch-repair endonuclease
VSEHFPVLIDEVLPGALDGKPTFPFRSWATANRFAFHPDAGEFLSQCGSAAEAFFARHFTRREGIRFTRPTVAIADQYTFELQVRCATYWIDAVVSSSHKTLAIEIDGMAFHHRSREQVAADYLRQRRIVLRGYTVIRFTAQEVFSDADQCWRQIESIFRYSRRS